MAERTALYRLFGKDGDLLYVGISVRPFARWGEHSSSKAWISEVAEIRLEWHLSRPAAEKAERSAILAENPLYNIVRPKPPPPKIRTIRPRTPPHVVPVPPGPARRVYAALPSELARALELAGRRCERARKHHGPNAQRAAERDLAALVYQALMLRVQPMSIRHTAWITYERVIRLRDQHMAENPDLPAPPLRPSQVARLLKAEAS